MRIKTFIFEVSNRSTEPVREEYLSESWCVQAASKIKSVEEIDAIINAYIDGKVVADIKVTAIDVLHHNNGGSNTVRLCYTITHQ